MRVVGDVKGNPKGFSKPFGNLGWTVKQSRKCVDARIGNACMLDPLSCVACCIPPIIDA